jgi:transglutaminase-like putative cysteine protease
MIVRHDCHYHYQPPVKNVVQILRLFPRSHEGQHIINWRVDVDVDAPLSYHEDTFGNLVYQFSLSGLAQWSVCVEGEVDTSDVAGVVRGGRERFPLDVFLRASDATQCDAMLAALAASVRGRQNTVLAMLHEVMGHVHEHFGAAVGPVDLTRTASQAYAQKSGSISDRVHVMVACARALGVPARLIAGYLGAYGDDGQACVHQWAECYVQDLGWVGFDPLLNLCPQDHHLRVSMGLDALSGALIRSALGSGSVETISSHIHIEQHQAQWQS